VSFLRGLGAFADLFWVRWNGLTGKYNHPFIVETEPVQSS
jgi:hypothetical protein